MKITILRLAIGIGILTPSATIASGGTYYKNVAVILQNRCQACHHPGDIAPMSLMTYQEARPWAKAIRTAVIQRKMPPWFADARYGHFENDRSLPQAEIDALVGWADSGAPEGNPQDAPKPIQFADGWRMGRPDAVVELPKPFQVPATGTIPYQYIVVPTGFTEDKWVQAVEVRPSNRTVVHHIIASLRPLGIGGGLPKGEYSTRLAGPGPDSVANAERRAARANGGEPPMFGSGDLLEVFVPGGRPPVFKDGQARLVKAGSDLLFQIHYTSTGKPAEDRTEIGFIFAKQPPKEQVRAGLVFNQRFTIPARAANEQIEARAVVKRDVRLYSILPHMHLRGKDFEFRAVYPTGESEILLKVPRYDFHWQISYYLAQPKLLPAGTVLECVGHFDNSANNPDNPDPNVDVHTGAQTWDEMLNGFLDFIVEPGTGDQEILGPVRGAASNTAAIPAASTRP